MPWDVPPIAVCTKCGDPLSMIRAQDSSGRCIRRIDGHRCRGTYYGSTLKRSDWALCKQCEATGSKGNLKCDLCHGSGWHLLRDPLY